MKIPKMGMQCGNMLISDNGDVIGEHFRIIIHGCICATELIDLHYITVFAVVVDDYSTRVLHYVYPYDYSGIVEDHKVVLEESYPVEIINIFTSRPDNNAEILMSTREGVKYVFDRDGNRLHDIDTKSILQRAIGVCGEEYIYKGNQYRNSQIDGYHGHLSWKGKSLYSSLGDKTFTFDHDIHGVDYTHGLYICTLAILSHGTLFRYEIREDQFTFHSQLPGEWKSVPLSLMKDWYVVGSDDLLHDASELAGVKNRECSKLGGLRLVPSMMKSSRKC